MARASPSIGAYLDSAGCVDLLLTKVIFHPSWQQNGLLLGQLQCFWNSQNPTPVFAQSVATHVGFKGSKIGMPSSISLTMTCFDFSKS